MKGFPYLAAALTVLATPAVFAQGSDPTTSFGPAYSPTYGNVVLEAGFDPDPRISLVASGGSVNMGAEVEGCEGYIAQAPLVRLTYTADAKPAALPLFIHVFSQGDTTLVIRAPDGRLYCNDDGFNGHNPMLIFGPAMSGDYDIWLGSFPPGKSHEAFLVFSETGADVSGLQEQLTARSGR